MAVSRAVMRVVADDVTISNPLHGSGPSFTTMRNCCHRLMCGITSFSVQMATHTGCDKM